MSTTEQVAEASKLIKRAAQLFEEREKRIQSLKAAVDALCITRDGSWSCKLMVDDFVNGVDVSISVSKGVLRPLIQAELVVLEAAQTRLKEKMDAAAEILKEEPEAA